MIVAGFDLGTNSFLCLVGENKGGEFIEHSDESRVVRLGQDMYQGDKKILHPDALKRAEICLKDFKYKALEKGAEKFYAVATSAARDSENSQELIDICRNLDIELEVISGKREAELTFKGAFLTEEASKSAMVVDVGGGSTEFLYRSNGETLAESLDIGAVRLTEKFVTKHPCIEEEIFNARQYAKNAIKTLELKENPNHLCAVAGTPTTLAAVILGLETFDKSKIDGFELTQDQLQDSLEKLAMLNLEERLALPGMAKGREDILVSGICILLEALNFFGHRSYRVSTRGVRYGLVNELLV